MGEEKLDQIYFSYWLSNMDIIKFVGLM